MLIPFSSIGWRPQWGPQYNFLRRPYRCFETLLEGNRGGGKTEAAIADFLRDVGQGWGRLWRGVVWRRTYKELEQVIEKAHRIIKAIYGNTVRFVGSPTPKFIFPEGEVLFFHALMRKDDHKQFIGEEFQWMFYEELCNWPFPDAYLSLMATLRSAVAEIARRIRVIAATNPYGVGHWWVKRRWNLPMWRNVINRTGKRWRLAIKFSFEENLALRTAQPDYLDTLEVNNEAQRAAWIEGDWNIVSGGMFSDIWNPKHHYVDPFEVPRSWLIHDAFDWGGSSPFSYAPYAQSDGSDVKIGGKLWSTVRGDLVRLREWYGCQRNREGERLPNKGLDIVNTEIAKGIIERQLKWGLHGRILGGPADPSIFNETNGTCYSDQLAQVIQIKDGRHFKGPQFFRGDNTRVAGWRDMRTYLKNAIRTDKPREKPGLFLVRGYNNDWEDTVPNLARDEKNLDDVDTEQEDHIGDENRYRCREGFIHGAPAAVAGTW